MSTDCRAEPSQAPNVRSGTVELIIGPAATSITVHEGVLRLRSHFFDAALNKCWKEGSLGKVVLPEEQPDTITTYIQYLYSGKIYIEETKTRDGLSESDNLPEYPILAELYVFGERVQDTTFKNSVMDAMAARVCEPSVDDETDNSFPVTSAVDIVYKGTVAGSKARQFMVDMHVLWGCGKWITPRSEDHNKDFLMDLAREMLDLRVRDRENNAIITTSLGEVDFSKYREKTESK
ncbi:hypothetical protein LTR56_010958 [Elasticomyces elasticus]|nr:hypothetical protein LTR56_010958 [Elasticomyces elasticus]KAK3662656.1 hypothetical protein LTR22_006506 [Elasticomyces elasticus]KAK4926560.1 hypothetical protein LTR49_006494 [Elasticomyces elasticus]KAK5760653.1 hypothetical protein LTS12_009190 [Elasticomyces elasticus]